MKSRSWLSQCFTVGAILRYSQLSCTLDRDSGRNTRRYGFNGYVDGTGAEGNKEKS